jgi:hypothetical protein
MNKGCGLGPHPLVDSEDFSDANTILATLQQLIAMLVHYFGSLAKLFATSNAPGCLDLTRPIAKCNIFGTASGGRLGFC